ncbi:MAG: hypothetical protein ABIZ50_05615, partial [Solirubrobacterales bacterium]
SGPGNPLVRFVEPSIRESWEGADGSLLKERGSPLEFLSDADRATWVAAGKPGEGGPRETSDRLGKSPPVDLTEDPDALREQLISKYGIPTEASAEAPHGCGAIEMPEGLCHALMAKMNERLKDMPSIEQSTDAMLFTRIEGLLGETSLTPGQRSALLEVASGLEGIELTGNVTDAIGRPGVAVSMPLLALTPAGNGVRQTLVFDPETSALLATEDVATAENPRYPEGTLLGHTTFLVRANVDELGERPGDKTDGPGPYDGQG